MGLPVATGETKIGISAWVSDLYDGVDAHMDADALNADENTVTIGKTPGTDYAIVPLLAQVEYPADSAVSEIILPDGVELLSYRSTDYELSRQTSRSRLKSCTIHTRSSRRQPPACM